MSDMVHGRPSGNDRELRRVEKVSEIAHMLAEDRGQKLEDSEIEGLFRLHDRLVKTGREIGIRVLRRRDAPWN